MNEAERKKRVAAMLRERAGYERTGQKARAAHVTKVLKDHGYEDPEEPKGREAPEAKKSTATEEPKAPEAKKVTATPKRPVKKA